MDTHVRRFDALNQRSTSGVHQTPSSNYKHSADHSSSSSSTSHLDTVPIIRDYDSIIHGSLHTFVELSRKIGSELSTLTGHVTRLFNAQKEFLRYAIMNRKPTSDQHIAEIIKPQSNEIEAICGEYRLKIFSNPEIFSCSSFSEQIPEIGFVQSFVNNF